MTARVLSTLRPSEVADDRSRQSFSLYQFLGDIGSLISDFTCCDTCYCSVACLPHVLALCWNGRRYLPSFFCIRQPPRCVKIWL